MRRLLQIAVQDISQLTYSGEPPQATWKEPPLLLRLTVGDQARKGYATGHQGYRAGYATEER
jgi:hypothetical protein